MFILFRTQPKTSIKKTFKIYKYSIGWLVDAFSLDSRTILFTANVKLNYDQISGAMIV